MVDTVTIKSENSGPTLEESARAMGIDPANIDSTATAQTPPENAKLLGKFSSPEELAKAYTELEKKLGQKSAAVEPDENALPSDEGEEQAPAVEDEPKPEEETVEEELANRGLDFSEFSSEYESNGELSTGSFEKLEKAGIPKALVEQFIAGQEAQRVLVQQTVFNEVGGSDNYDSMISWAGDNLSAEEIEAYNTAVDGSDTNARMMAVRGLKARYEAVRGREPSVMLEGQGRSAGNNSVYSSVAEMKKDMNDPRYKQSPAFRQKVEQKLARSNIL